MFSAKSAQYYQDMINHYYEYNLPIKESKIQLYRDLFVDHSKNINTYRKGIEKLLLKNKIKSKKGEK